MRMLLPHKVLTFLLVGAHLMTLPETCSACYFFPLMCMVICMLCDRLWYDYDLFGGQIISLLAVHHPELYWHLLWSIGTLQLKALGLKDGCIS